MNQATLDFIREHAEADVRRLALQGTKNPEVDLTFALEQIAGRQKAKTKLPSWAAIDGIVWPPHLSMEQCSSEQTARYKALIAGKGALIVDLTAGFGVDMAFISQGFQRAIHVERQAQLCTISSENYKLLGLNHIEVVCADGVDYLHQLDHADLIYLDPARRDDHGARTYGIADCTPNVLELRDELLAKADRVMLKLSPMLDWRKAVEDLGHVSEVHIVSVDNECKELLLILSKDEKSLRLFCVNNDQVFEASDLTHETSSLIPHPSSFLFEPNASIMKAGCFAALEQRFGVQQLDKNSHLFVADHDISDFPGRRFIIEKTTSMNKRELKAALAGIGRANITVRNFPMSVAELRKRLKLKDGGDLYLFATTLADNQHQLFLCRKTE
ncbi:MAG: RsmD family RNA methyltransferase [Prevotella sp.]|nr:RsmD family RNA methyltransferase [Prevotella sp.]